MDGIRVNERDLQTVQAAAGGLVDQLRSFVGEGGEGGCDVVHPVRNVVHSWSAANQEATDRRVLGQCAEELDTAFADDDRDRLDSLFLEPVAVLELGAEQARVRVEGLLEIVDRDAEVVNPPGPHAVDATGVRSVPGTVKRWRRKCADFVPATW